MLAEKDKIFTNHIVIPAKIIILAGIQRAASAAQEDKNWMPAFAGMTGKYYA